MNEIELKRAALVFQTNCLSHSPLRKNLRMLIKEIDDFDRSPTEMDILALAKKYRETPDLVRIVFETKGDRASSLESPKKRQDAWLQEEVEIVTALKSNIREAVRRLNELDINKNRGVKRTRKSVELKLRRLGV